MRIVEPVDPHVFWQAEMSEPVEQRTALIFDRTEEEFCRTLLQYPSIGGEVDGKQVGGCFVDNNNFIHIAVLPEYQGKWGHLFSEGMKWAFTISNTLYALVAKDNLKVRKLVKRVGWQMIWEHEFSELYRVTPDTTRILK